MKSLLIAAAVAASVALSGCTTPPPYYRQPTIWDDWPPDSAWSRGCHEQSGGYGCSPIEKQKGKS